MTVLLYNRIDLEERSGRSYNFWKGCHLTAYVLAAVFGILNCYFLYVTTNNIFEARCILDPRQLVFKEVLPSTTQGAPVNVTEIEVPASTTEPEPGPLLLDVPDSSFHSASYCDLPLSVPLGAAVAALVWIALFLMCPAGGRAKRGLSEPWRILTPALLCAVVLLLVTGHNFLRTNSGLLAFCAQFHNHTDTYSCTSAMDEYIPTSSTLAASTALMLCRAACAASFAAWAVAAALLLARCVGGRDFAVHRTQVTMVKKSPKPVQRRPLNPNRSQVSPLPTPYGGPDGTSNGTPQGTPQGIPQSIPRGIPHTVQHGTVHGILNGTSNDTPQRAHHGLPHDTPYGTPHVVTIEDDDVTPAILNGAPQVTSDKELIELSAGTKPGAIE